MHRSIRILFSLSVISAGLTVAVANSAPAGATGTYTEYAGGGGANTWTNYTNAGGNEGPHISASTPIQITCALQGFRVADGNTWWYQIGSSPWNNNYYVSADAFYNDGATSGSLLGTPWVDPAVPQCGGNIAKYETTGGVSHTWSDYSDAGGTEGPQIGTNATVGITCALQGFRVADGNTWWYQIGSSPWNDAYYVSADAFYNNGATSGSLLGTPFVDPAIPLCAGTTQSSPPPGGTNETTGGVSHTFTDYSDAGGTQGPSIPSNDTVVIACKVTGFAVADGNTWWYQIASSPWSGQYYVSADAFYNNGEISGSLLGTPFVDPSVPSCSGSATPHPAGETTGTVVHTWANYSHAGASEGPTIPQGTTVSVSCRVTGFRVADGDTWWYLISSAPWNSVYYASADPFYNDGATSGPLAGTPFVDPSVPICVGNQEAPIYSSAYGSSSATSHSTGCVRADPVNCASGDFWQAFTDASISGRGPGLDLTRTYNDLQASSQGLFGNGWSSSYDQRLVLGAVDGSILVRLADGSEMIAEPNGSGGYTLPPSTDDSLTVNGDGSYTLTEKATEFLTFSSTGSLTSLKDLNGYQTSLGYNGSSQLSSVTDSSGRVLQVTHGSNGLVSSIVDPMGRTTRYTYDSSGNLTSVADPLGRTTSFTYDSNSLLLTMTDPRGGVVANTYDAEDRVTAQTDPAGRTTTFAYTGDNFSSLGGTTTITDPLGNVEVEKYANGFLTQATKAYGTTRAATWSYTYDPNTFGITSATDPDGNVTTHTYDGDGNVLSTTDPLGRTTSYTYNALNEVLTSTTPLGEMTTHTYDNTGNLLSTTGPTGNTATNTFGDSSHPGDITTATDPAGEVTTYTYDTAGNRISKSTWPSSGVIDTTMYAFDTDGDQTCETSPNATAAGVRCAAAGNPRVANTTTTGYDADREVTKSINPLGQKTKTAYDADGNTVRVKDPEGNTTSYTYDADNELTQTTQANGGTSSTTYDGDGNKLTTADPNGNTTTNSYNALNQLTSATNALGNTTRYGYDLDGNRLTATDPDGRVTTDTYDADNELTATSYSDGVTPDVGYAYDSDGQRTSMEDGTGTTIYVYDAMHRLTSSTDGAGQTTSYGYDADGRLTSTTYPNAKDVTQGYDEAGNLLSVHDWLGNTSTFTYDHDGNELSAVLGTTKDKYKYDADDELTSINDTVSATRLQGFTYSHNSNSLVSSVTPASKSPERYSYNRMNELTEDSSGSYAYDAAGNLTKSLTATSVTYNAANELTSSGSTTYGYNAEEERINANTTQGGAATYHYDQAGRLIKFTKGSKAAAYEYNGDGLRTSKTVGSNVSTFTWDLAAATPLLLSDGTNSYIYGPSGLPIEGVTAGGSVTYYHHDQLGSTTLLTSATGAVTATYTYDSYGELGTHIGTASSSLLFAGQYLDAESGLYYLQARYYDPKTGQFTTSDPLANLTNQPFSYAGNDPTNQTDPTGLFCVFGHNPNGSCRGSTEAESAAASVAGSVSKVINVAETANDIANLVSSCEGNWAAQSCGRAIQVVGIDAVVDDLSILCKPLGPLATACGAVLSAGGTYLLNHYGIVVPGSNASTPPSATSEPGTPAGSSPQNVSGESSGNC